MALKFVVAVALIAAQVSSHCLPPALGGLPPALLEVLPPSLLSLAKIGAPELAFTAPDVFVGGAAAFPGVPTLAPEVLPAFPGFPGFAKEVVAPAFPGFAGFAKEVVAPAFPGFPGFPGFAKEVVAPAFPGFPDVLLGGGLTPELLLGGAFPSLPAFAAPALPAIPAIAPCPPTPTKIVNQPDIDIPLPLPAEVPLGRFCSCQKYSIKPALVPCADAPDVVAVPEVVDFPEFAFPAALPKAGFAGAFSKGLFL